MPRAPLLLATDVGGTKTACGLYAGGGRRPAPRVVERFATGDYPHLDDLLAVFLARHAPGGGIAAAALGVAGPVRDGASTLTNVPWRVEARALGDRFGIPHVRLLNDLEAMGHAVAVLTPDDLAAVQAGAPAADGNAVLLAPGTGFGATVLHRVAGQLAPVAAEAGHADFAARTAIEIDLLRALTARDDGRVSCEHVLSGPGLVRIHAFLHRDAPCRAIDGPPAAPGDAAPRRITDAALARRCPRCVAALDLFVGALGAEAGNAALRAMATAGVYIGGGIAPRILPVITSSAFLDPFRAKGPMAPLLAAMPVQVIRTPDPALLGAAVAAGALLPNARGAGWGNGR